MHSRRRFDIGKLPLPIALAIDLVLAAIIVGLFALYDIVMPHSLTSLDVVSARPGTTVAQSETASASADETPSGEIVPVAGAYVTAEVIAEVTAQVTAAVSAAATGEPMESIGAEATADPVGYFGTKFADMFIEGEAQVTTEENKYTYVSENVRVTATTGRKYDADYYVADIYVKDISNLRAGFAGDKYGKGLRDWVKNIAGDNDAIVAINGDYYGARSYGVVIRNGILYRNVDSASGADVCVLYWDGTMETYTSKEFDADEAVANGAYQAWCFGPMLVGDDGEAMTKFTTTVASNNPRTVIGYFEPGHYCFVVVDGRSSASSGMSMKELSHLMVSLGCVKAYNLDGGQTSVMTIGTKVVSEPYKGGRKCSDIIYIGE